MELRQLGYFVAVAEEGHFTRAAERARVAQPAISQQIRRLESELGERLFRREGRSISLTAAGETLLPCARAMLNEAADAKESIAALSGLLTGNLAIGLIQDLPDRRVLELIGAFHRRHPRIRLTLLEEETDALLDALASGQLDVAVVGQGLADAPLPDDMSPHVIAREGVGIAVHPDHPLAGRRSLALASLRDEPIVTAPRSSKLRTNFEFACEQAGFTPNVVAETRDLTLIRQLVLQRIGVAVLPDSAFTSAPRVTRVRLAKPAMQRRVVIAAQRRHLGPAGRAFLAMAHTQLPPVRTALNREQPAES